MNDDSIEQEVLGILLNHPEKIEAIPLESDWFAYPEYGILFKSIQEANSDSILDIYGKYHQLSKQPLDFSVVKSLGNNNPFPHLLDRDIQVMKQLAFNRELSEAAKNYRENPFKETEEELREVLDKKQPDKTTDDGSLNEAIDVLLASLDKPQPRGIKTYKKLDMVLGGGMYGSMLFTIGARPSTGKTAFSVNLAYEAMQHDSDLEVDFFTLEMNKQEMLNRFVSRMTGISSSILRSKPNEIDAVLKPVIEQDTDELKQSHLRVYENMEQLDQIVQTIKKNAGRAKQGKYLAIIDYIGLVKVPNVKDRYLEVGEITRELKRLTNEFDIPIVALSQLSRGIENRTDKTPILSDLRESGSIEQDSNVVAFLHRPYKTDDANVVQLSVRKNREGELGDINFNFIGSEMKFQELDA